jgi:hypothetical protein
MSHILECYEIAKTDFVRAENCYVYDRQGKRYVDLESGCWAAVLGHNPKRIQRVIREQCGKLTHIGKRYPNETAELAAADVLGITGLAGGKCVLPQFRQRGGGVRRAGRAPRIRQTSVPDIFEFLPGRLRVGGRKKRRRVADPGLDRL